jgi:hypothetical protein
VTRAIVRAISGVPTIVGRNQTTMLARPKLTTSSAVTSAM